jgi:methyl-accepting chemotaxis protein
MTKLFNRLSLNQKLIAVNVLGALAATAILIATVFQIVTAEMGKQAVERQKMNVGIAREMLAHDGAAFRVKDGKLMVGERVIDGDHTVVDRMRELLGVTTTIFRGDERVSTTVTNPDGSRAVGTRLAQGPIYDQVLRQGREYMGEANVLGTPFLLAYTPLKDPSGAVVGAMVVGMKKSAFFDLVHGVTWPIALVSAACGLALSGLLYVFAKRQLRSLTRLAGVVDALAERRFDTEVTDTGRGDEIGAIAKAIAHFKSVLIRNDELDRERGAQVEAEERRARELEEITRAFAESADAVVKGVTRAAAAMRGDAEALSRTAEDTTTQAASVAAAADQATANVETVAAAAEELSASISEISRRVGEASSVAGRAVREAEVTNDTVRGLAEAANRIGEVVGLINTIAGQTNLLALNATIEAARAGEAGKGFAVVASEVKNLANQTAKATDDIQAQVAAIQAETRRAVDAISGIATTIGTISEITTGVAAAVEEQGAATGEIARNVQEASVGTSQVSGSIGEVNRAATHTGASAQSLLEAASELTQQADHLHREVEGFIVRVRAR